MFPYKLTEHSQDNGYDRIYCYLNYHNFKKIGKIFIKVKIGKTTNGGRRGSGKKVEYR